MQQQPVIPIANATMPAAIPPQHRITWRRCLAIVTLGLTAALFFSPIRVGPWWWQPVVAAAVLGVAALMNAIRSAGSGLSIGWALRGPVATGVVTGVLGVAAIVPAYFSSKTEYDTSFVLAVLEGMVVAVLVGLVSALLAQSQPSTPVAVLGVVLGWTAAIVGNLVAWVFSPTGIGTSGAAHATFLGGLVTILLYGGIGGMALAVLGGLLGRGLRGLAKNSAT
jgi:hypothetical protein